MKNPHLHTAKKHSKPFINRLVYVAAILYPLMTLPQIVKVYQTHSAQDLALPTWILYVVFELIFLTYGLKNKIKPLIITGLLWLIIYAFMLTGIFLYS